MTVARAARLAHGTLSSSGMHTVYTAPAATTVIVRALAFQNGGGGTSSWSLGLTPAGGGANVDFDGFSTDSPMPSGHNLEHEYWQVLAPGDSLYIYVNTGSSLDYWLSGAVLTT